MGAGSHAGRVLAAGVLSVYLLGQAAPVRADTFTDIKVKIAQAQTAVRDLTASRQGQQAVVEQLRGVTGAYANDLHKVDAELMASVARFRQAEAELERVNAETQALEDEILQKEEAVQQRAGVYGTRLRALYKFTRTSPLEQLLGARSFSDALHRISMMQAVTRVDNRLLGQLRVEHDDLLVAREALSVKQAEAVVLRDELNVQRQALEEQRGQQASLVRRAQQDQQTAEFALTQYDREVNAQGGRIVSLQAQYQRELEELERQREAEQRRQEESRRMEDQRRAEATAAAQATQRARTAATATAAAAPQRSPTPAPPGARPAVTPTPERQPARTTGPAATVAPLPGSVKTTGLLPSTYNMIYPVMNPVVTTEYGEKTFAQSFHSGIDLAQNNRTPVLAAADGKVLESGLAVPGNPSASYGMMVTIAHDTKLSTLYAHLDVGGYAPTVKAGDNVKRGQIVGYIGMTGLTSGPHLHFEVRESGQHQNPRKYLPK